MQELDPTMNGTANETMEELPVNAQPNVYTAVCPECDSRLRFRKALKLGQLLLCPECNEHLEVISIKPLELGWADESPWNYDDYEDSWFASGSGNRD